MDLNESENKQKSVLENIENIEPNLDQMNLVKAKQITYEDDDDVFGLNECGKRDKFIESEPEEEEEIDEFHMDDKHILQKRNSNSKINEIIQIKRVNNVQTSKFSCSLPRDIIPNRHFSIKGDENTENFKRHKQNSNDSDEIKQNSDDEYEKCGDMGLAISNLASSIVAKDGRELFGGVPSRRIPINSISQSFV